MVTPVILHGVVSPEIQSAVERTWHVHAIEGQITAFAVGQKSFNPFKLFPLRSEAVTQIRERDLLPQRRLT